MSTTKSWTFKRAIGTLTAEEADTLRPRWTMLTYYFRSGTRHYRLCGVRSAGVNLWLAVGERGEGTLELWERK
jgi:hypothetical protein